MVIPLWDHQGNRRHPIDSSNSEPSRIIGNNSFGRHGRWSPGARDLLQQLRFLFGSSIKQVARIVGMEQMLDTTEALPPKSRPGTEDRPYAQPYRTRPSSTVASCEARVAL